jgi:UDP-N-acetylmuramoylalanine--D-glutamate ligase
MLNQVDWYAGKRITVMGLGLHGGGLGVARWLLRHGARLTVTDLRSADTLARPLAVLEQEYGRGRARRGRRVYRPALVLGRHRQADFREADLVIANPAVPRENRYLAFARKRGIPVESDISLFFHLCPFPITGITGTKGKSTTTALLGAICTRHDERTVVGGNIRVSPFSFLDRLLRLSRRAGLKPPPVILELSSWQLESLEQHCLSPRVAVITNVMRDHLNRYGGRMASYAAAKELAVRFQGPDDIAVVNGADQWVEAMAKRLAKKAPLAPQVLRFARDSRQAPHGCAISRGQVVLRTGGRVRPVISLQDIPLLGEHNQLNVLAAVAAAAALKIPVPTMRSAIKRFPGVSGRLETVAAKSGVTYVNDTTATTPDASVAAVQALASGRKPQVILIAGGTDKDLDFRAWVWVVPAKTKELILLPGNATDRMLTGLKRHRARRPWLAESMAQAVKLAHGLATAGDTVVLSPGAASFGLFQNEFDRGDQFVRAAKRLK